MKQSQKFKKDYDEFRLIKLGARDDYLKTAYESKQVQQKIPDIKQKFEQQYTYLNTNKIKQHVYATKVEKPAAIVIFFHGLNSCSQSYAHYANYLKKLSISTYALDQQGFGKSQGDFGIIRSSEETVNDSINFIKKVKQENQGIKCFIGGLSYGGAIVFKIGITHPDLIDGLILLAPALKDHPYNAPYLKKLVSVIGWLFPSIKTITPSFQHSSKYTCYQQMVIRNQYIYTGKVVPGSIRQVLNLMNQCSENYGKLNIPYVIVQGTVDKLVNPFQALDLQDLSPAEDKTTIIIKGLWHALSTDPLIWQILPILGQWLQQRI